MITIESGFPSSYRSALVRAIKTIHALSVESRNFAGMPGEFRQEIMALLRPGSGREWDLNYGGMEGECRRWKSYTLGYYVAWICKKAFTAKDEQGNNRLPTILFHEMVHACGGDELDAETLEMVYFKDRGATPPDHGDFEEFESLGDQGRWFTLRRDKQRGVAVVYHKGGRKSGIVFALR